MQNVRLNSERDGGMYWMGLGIESDLSCPFFVADLINGVVLSCFASSKINPSERGVDHRTVQKVNQHFPDFFRKS